MSEQDESLEHLAQALEDFIDRSRISSEGRVYLTKGLVARNGELQFYVRTDHPPAHFHVISRQRNFDVRINLFDFSLLSVKRGDPGSISDLLKKIRYFFEQNPEARARLLSEYVHLNP